MDRILQHLSDYALGLSYEDLPREVVDRAKHIGVDTVGCALGAFGTSLGPYRERRRRE